MEGRQKQASSPTIVLLSCATKSLLASQRPNDVGWEPLVARYDGGSTSTERSIAIASAEGAILPISWEVVANPGKQPGGAEQLIQESGAAA